MEKQRRRAARILEVSQSRVSRLMTGKGETFSLEMLINPATRPGLHVRVARFVMSSDLSAQRRCASGRSRDIGPRIGRAIRSLPSARLGLPQGTSLGIAWGGNPRSGGHSPPCLFGFCLVLLRLRSLLSGGRFAQ
jgi:hypothetical protein